MHYQKKKTKRKEEMKLGEGHIVGKEGSLKKKIAQIWSHFIMYMYGNPYKQKIIIKKSKASVLPITDLSIIQSE